MTSLGVIRFSPLSPFSGGEGRVRGRSVAIRAPWNRGSSPQPSPAQKRERGLAQRFIGVTAFVLAGFAALAPAQAIEIQRVVSPGGIEAWLVEEHSNPIMAISFSFVGGAALDPVGQEGRARMTSALLDEGAGDLDSQAFQGELDRLSIQLGFGASDDDLSGNVTTLTKTRARAVELLQLALTEPRFDAEPVERVRGQLQVRLSRKASDPNSVAYDTLDQLVFAGHPYGRPSEGTPESVGALTADDLRAFVLQRLALDTLKIGVVGDITPAELGPLLDQVFGGLPKTSPPVAVTEIVPQGAGVVTVVQKPVTQSVIFVAQPGPKRDDPDFYAAAVVNYVLGGGSFSSRLYEEVREKRGLAYSVWSDLRAYDHAGLWYAGAGTQNARAAETLDIIRAEWTRLAQEGPTDEEVASAITYLTGSFALRLTSSEGIANLLVAIQRADLGIDYVDQRASYYASLTAEEVRRVAKAWLDPAKLAVVVVGQPDGLASSGQ